MNQRQPTEQDSLQTFPLDYERPRSAPRGARRDTWLGIFAAIFISGGIGLATFGILMEAGFRDDHAGPIAVGAGLFLLGGSFFALMIWLRRSYH